MIFRCLILKNIKFFILKKYSGKNIQWLSANKSEGIYIDGKFLKPKYEFKFID